jgi:hypothetical protein
MTLYYLNLPLTIGTEYACGGTRYVHLKTNAVDMAEAETIFLAKLASVLDVEPEEIHMNDDPGG